MPIFLLGIPNTPNENQRFCTSDMDYWDKANWKCHILPWVLVTHRSGLKNQLREILAAQFKGASIYGSDDLNLSPTPWYFFGNGWRSSKNAEPMSSALSKAFPGKQPHVSQRRTETSNLQKAELFVFRCHGALFGNRMI